VKGLGIGRTWARDGGLGYWMDVKRDTKGEWR
jgi:hypothetical protein